jgi:hypothetical protein
MVEHVAHNDAVVGSTPAEPRILPCFCAKVIDRNPQREKKTKNRRKAMTWKLLEGISSCKAAPNTLFKASLCCRLHLTKWLEPCSASCYIGNVRGEQVKCNRQQREALKMEDGRCKGYSEAVRAKCNR